MFCYQVVWVWILWRPSRRMLRKRYCADEVVHMKLREIVGVARAPKHLKRQS